MPLPRLVRRVARAVLPPKALTGATALWKWVDGERAIRLLPQLADPGRAAVDVGANAGVYSWHLARLCPAAKSSLVGWAGPNFPHNSGKRGIHISPGRIAICWSRSANAWCEPVS